MNINMKSNTIKNRDLQIAIAVFWRDCHVLIVVLLSGVAS